MAVDVLDSGIKLATIVSTFAIAYATAVGVRRREKREESSPLDAPVRAADGALTGWQSLFEEAREQRDDLREERDALRADRDTWRQRAIDCENRERGSTK